MTDRDEGLRERLAIEIGERVHGINVYDSAVKAELIQESYAAADAVLDVLEPLLTAVYAAALRHIGEEMNRVLGYESTGWYAIEKADEATR